MKVCNSHECIAKLQQLSFGTESFCSFIKILFKLTEYTQEEMMRICKHAYARARVHTQTHTHTLLSTSRHHH